MYIYLHPLYCFLDIIIYQYL